MNNTTIKIVVINVIILTANKLKKLSKVNSIRLIYKSICIKLLLCLIQSVVIPIQIPNKNIILKSKSNSSN